MVVRADDAQRMVFGWNIGKAAAGSRKCLSGKLDRVVFPIALGFGQGVLEIGGGLDLMEVRGLGGTGKDQETPHYS